MNDRNEDVLEEDDRKPEDATVEQTTLQGSLQNSRLAVLVFADGLGPVSLFATFNGPSLGEALEFSTRAFSIEQKFFLVIGLQHFVDSVLLCSFVQNKNVSEFEAVCQSPAKRPDDAFHVREREEWQVHCGCHRLGFVQRIILKKKQRYSSMAPIYEIIVHNVQMNHILQSKNNETTI